MRWTIMYDKKCFLTETFTKLKNVFVFVDDKERVDVWGAVVEPRWGCDVGLVFCFSRIVVAFVRGCLGGGDLIVEVVVWVWYDDGNIFVSTGDL